MSHHVVEWDQVVLIPGKAVCVDGEDRRDGGKGKLYCQGFQVSVHVSIKFVTEDKGVGVLTKIIVTTVNTVTVLPCEAASVADFRENVASIRLACF